MSKETKSSADQLNATERKLAEDCEAGVDSTDLAKSKQVVASMLELGEDVREIRAGNRRGPNGPTKAMVDFVVTKRRIDSETAGETTRLFRIKFSKACGAKPDTWPTRESQDAWMQKGDANQKRPSPDS